MNMTKQLLLIAAIIILNFMNISGAETDSLPVYNMGAIVIYGERSDDIKAASIQQMNAEEIKNLDVRNFQEALSFSPGIYFSTTTKNETTFRLRGFEQRQISVFLDGIPVSVPFDGLIDLSQFSGDNLQKIRISRGVSSVLYGANTLGGSVNILTKPASNKTRVNFRSEYSDHGRLFSNLSLSTGIDKISFSTSLSYDKADPYRLPDQRPQFKNQTGSTRQNSAFEKKSASVKLQYKYSAAHLFGLQFHTVNNNFNVPSNVSVERPRFWRFPYWNKYVYSLNSQHVFSPNFMLRLVAFYDSYKNKLRSFDDENYSSQLMKYAFDSYYDDYSFGFTLYPQFDIFPFGITEGVLTYKQDTHRERGNKQESYQHYATDSYICGIEQSLNIISSLYINAGMDLNYLVSSEAYQTELRDPILLYNGQITFQKSLKNALAIHLSTASKSRFPTLKELYSERLGRNIANPELSHESAWNTEIGLQWEQKNIKLQSAIFYNRLADLITNKQLGDGIQQLQNIGKAEITGLELSSEYRHKKFIVNSNYTFLHARNISQDRTNDHLEYRPAHRLNIFIKYQILKQLGFSVNSEYTEGQYYQHPDTGNWQNLNEFGLVNLKLDYSLYDYAVIYLRSENIFDRFYYSEFGIPMPGREIIIGTRINF